MLPGAVACLLYCSIHTLSASSMPECYVKFQAVNESRAVKFSYREIHFWKCNICRFHSVIIHIKSILTKLSIPWTVGCWVGLYTRCVYCACVSVFFCVQRRHSDRWLLTRDTCARCSDILKARQGSIRVKVCVLGQFSCSMMMTTTMLSLCAF